MMIIYEHTVLRVAGARDFARPSWWPALRAARAPRVPRGDSARLIAAAGARRNALARAGRVVARTTFGRTRLLALSRCRGRSRSRSRSRSGSRSACHRSSGRVRRSWCSLRGLLLRVERFALTSGGCGGCSSCCLVDALLRYELAAAHPNLDAAGKNFLMLFNERVKQFRYRK